MDLEKVEKKIKKKFPLAISYGLGIGLFDN
jgi:hypothetical protein